MSIDTGTIIIAFIAAAILAKAVTSGKEERKIEEDFLEKIKKVLAIIRVILYNNTCKEAYKK